MPGNFDKFAKGAISGAQKKEAIKQDKRKAKKESDAYHKERRSANKPKAAQPILKDEKESKGKGSKGPAGTPIAAVQHGPMALNKYIAHSGLCSRRDAAALVKEGAVKVNGTVVQEPGSKVNPGDIVKVNGKTIELQKQLIYILLNKPKDYITTAEDEKGRKTVLDLVKSATSERVFPVGRLDRNTTGVLLITNDGELTQHLTHPSFEVRKIYEATLDKAVEKKDLEQLVNGITLEDGFVQADAAGYADSKDKSVVGIEIHSGKNRVVRRMFEHLGYDVRALDRVMFASLTKKNVDRGTWRFLTEKEVRLLKYFNKSKRKNKETVELQDAPFTGKTGSKQPPQKQYNITKKTTKK